MAQQLNLDRSQRVDIVCREGDTFTLNLELKDDLGVAIDVTGHTFLMQVRVSDEDETLTDASADVPLLMTVDLTDASDGLVKFSKTAANMKDVSSGLYVYDISQNNTSTEETILYGTFKVNEDISIT